MPEGDTIFRTAARLRMVLDGHRIVQATSRQPAFDAQRLLGTTVGCVEARGKHMLIHLESGGAVHAHLGMSGSWHIYRHGQRWTKPEQRATLTISTQEYVVVCFSPKLLELLSADALRRNDYLQRLGPDLLDQDQDPTVIVARYRVHDRTPIGEAVMNQTIACGVGNVYKSELLFLHRLHPLQPVGSLSDQQILALVASARRLMSQNLQGQARRTRFGRDGSRLWVYGRGGEPCFRCGQSIQITRQGDLGRSTYYCPGCQASGDEARQL